MEAAVPNMDIKLADFEISEDLGFLLRDPLEFLPPYFEPWNLLAKETPDLILKEKVREKVEQMPILDYKRLNGYKEKRLAHLQLGVICAGYVWQNGKNNLPEYLPSSVAVPIWGLSKELGLPPGLTFASLYLAGWQKIDKNGGVEYENLRCLYCPSSEPDNLNFIRKMIQIDLEFAPAIKGILNGVRSIAEQDDDGYINALNTIRNALQQMITTLANLKDVCNPDVFLRKLFPFLAGYGDPGSPLKEGLIFQGVDDKPIKFPHPTGAQSLTIPCIDEFLGLKAQEEGKELKKVTYNSMLPCHRRFLETLQNFPSASSYAEKSSNEAVKTIFNDLVKSLAEFRSVHIQMVTKYVIIPSNELQKELNLPKDKPLAVMGMLKTMRDDTQGLQCTDSK